MSPQCDGMFYLPHDPPGQPPGTVMSLKCIIRPIRRGGLGGLKNEIYSNNSLIWNSTSFK